MVNQEEPPLLLQKERQELIDLLLKVPHIRDDKEIRSSLTKSLHESIISNIHSDGDAQSHITDIVDIVSCTAYAKWDLGEGQYPILTVVENAIHKVGGGPIQDALKTMKEKLRAKFRPSTTLGLPTVTGLPTVAGLPTIVKTISSYRDDIDNVLEKLLTESWLRFKSDSALINTIDKELRDITTNLEQLKKRGKEKNVDIEAVLNALYEAYTSLTQALMLSDETSVQERIKYPEKIKVCRDNLNVASGLMIEISTSTDG